MSRFIPACLIVAICSFTEISLAQGHTYSRKAATRSEVIARRGIVATSHPLATQVALDILKLGGNAIDAAIAANAMLALVEPSAAGIGGDLAAMVWDSKSGKLYGLNAVGTSPADLTPDLLRKLKVKEIPATGTYAITVPGCVDGWFELHKKFGKLSIEEILAPAIYYAEEGFPLTESIADFLKQEALRLNDIPSFAEVFMPVGNAPSKGELFRNEALANTFRRLSEAGLRDFYEGDVAQEIASFIKANNGMLSADDLQNYHSGWVTPLSTNYRGYQVWALPPSNQGIIMLEMMNLLGEKEIQAMGTGSKSYIHQFVEAKKLVYDDRDKLIGDPESMKLPMENLLSEHWTREKFMQINPVKVGKSDPPALVENDNLVYISIADAEGNMISLVQSNYIGMGSGVTAPTLGFVFQNRGSAFHNELNRANTYGPGKRPIFTGLPGFVTKDGKPWMCFGMMDGKMQIQGHVQILVNMIDFGLSLQKAADASRFYHEPSSIPATAYSNETGWINLEQGYNYETIRELMKIGHRIKFDTDAYGGFIGILRDTVSGVYYGAVESSKDGQVSGY